MNGRKLVTSAACMAAIGGAALVTAGPADAIGTWGDGKITFISSRTGSPDVFVMHDDGSHQRNLTPGTDANEDGPGISPNGKRVAFSSYDGGDTEIYVISTTGGKARQVTKNDTTDRSPAWSPDGKKLAYSCADGHGTNLCVLNLKSEHVKHVTHGALDVFSPTWSPDGKKLAFSNETAGDYDIWTVHSDGSHLRDITNTPEGEYTAAWSPDGKLLALDTINGIEFVSPKTGKPSGATFAGGLPSWSPDGKRIDYYVYDGTDGEIYSAKPDGTHVRNLTDNDVEDYFYD
jgi:TolB protein